jgi:hypothetical protein
MSRHRIAKRRSQHCERIDCSVVIDPPAPRYRVVVASITDYQEAIKTAAKLNSMKVLPAPASVGQPKFGNPYFPVIIDGWLTLPDAKLLRDRVSGLDLGLPDPPYISIRDY